MLSLFDRTIDGHRLTIVASERSDGDIHPDRVPTDVLASRQRAATGDRWMMLDQVHGTTVHDLDRAVGADRTVCGIGDVMVTAHAGPHLAIWAADCAAVYLATSAGRLVAAHAGWRGLAAGVIDVAVDAALTADEHDAEIVAAVLGPVVHPCCYEFGADDLDAVARGVGICASALVAETASGARALDVPAAVRAGLGRRGVTLDAIGPCTGCDPTRWFSHRVRGDAGRHATIGWMEPSNVSGAPR